MSELIMNIPPSKDTVGEVGDIVTVKSTGDKYELIAIRTTSTYHGIQTVYDWDLIDATVNDIANLVGGDA